MTRILDAIALFIGGLALGATAAAVQAGRVEVLGRTVPWGLAAVLLAIVVGVRGSSWWRGSRRAGAAVAAGWFVSTAVLAATGPGGDVLLPGGPDSAMTRVYLLSAAVLAGLAAGMPVESRDATTPTDPPAATEVADRSGLAGPAQV